MWSSLNFQSRVLLLFIGLLLLAVISGSTAMFFAAKSTSLGLAEQQLWVADRLVQKTLDSTDNRLRESTNAAVADFGLLEAIASRDRPTIVSALETQAGRIHADTAMLLDETGGITASAGQITGATPPAALVEALLAARAHKSAPIVLPYGGGLLQIVVVPVRAPETIGWLAMGIFIRGDQVQQIKDIGGVDISLIVKAEGGGLNIIASTLSAAAQNALAHSDQTLVDKSSKIESLRLGEDDYLALASTDVGSARDSFFVVLALPMSVVVEPMSALRRHLFVSGLIIVLVCVLASVLSARMLAQPVRALADAARSISMSKRRSKPKNGESDDELSHLAEAFHALAQRAHYDALTGLPNRTLLKDRLLDSMERMKIERLPVAVVFIDLNGFKSINDSLGHEMGDLVLRKTAQRLSRSLVAPNTVARLGGDEFVLVLEGVSESAALRTVDRLMEVVATPMKSPSGTIKVGMSAGIAMYPSLSLDRETLLKLADAAMYQAKLKKRGPVVAKAANPCQHQTAEDNLPLESSNDESADGTWSNHWRGRDLATQTTAIVPASSVERESVLNTDSYRRMARDK